MRMLALLRKEIADERQNLALFVPALIVGIMTILLPLFVAVIVPSLSTWTRPLSLPAPVCSMNVVSPIPTSSPAARRRSRSCSSAA